MKKNRVAIAMSLALLMTAVAHAQTIHLKANVPFSFTAGRTTFPPGPYDVQSTGNGDSVLVIRSLNSKPEAFVISNACELRNPSAQTKLIFHRYGQKYFLSEVWMQGDNRGRQVPASSREVEVAKDLSMDKVVLLAKSD